MGKESTALAVWLSDQMARRKVGRNQLAEYSEVSGYTLSKILNDGHIPKPVTLLKLSRYFKVPLLSLLELQ